MQAVVYMTGLHTRPPDDHGDTRGSVVGCGVFSVDAQLTHVLAVIRTDDDYQVVEDAGRLKFVHQLLDMSVHVANTAVVAIDELSETCHVIQFTRMPRVARVGLVVVHADLSGLVRPDHLSVLHQHLFSEPGGQWVLGERIAEFSGSAVGSMRIPVVDVQEPVVLACMAANPIHGGRCDVLSGLHAPLTRVVHLVEACVKPPGGMPLGKGTDGDSAQTRPAQKGRQVVTPAQVSKAPRGAFKTQIGCRAAVTHDSGVDTESPGHESRSRRQARGVRAMIVVEAHSF